MSSITDDLAQARGSASIPKGAFWEALSALRDKDEDGYQAYTDALFATTPDGKYELGNVTLQKILVKNTGIKFGHGRVNEIRAQYDNKGELPV